MNEIIKYIKGCKKYDDLYDISWKLFLNKPMDKKYYKNMKVALFNVPCGGFGDVIACKTIYDYLTEWYPGLNVYICTPDIDKFKSISVDIKNMISMERIDSTDCPPLSQLKIKKNIKFDMMLVVPVVKRTFFINELKPLIPYATYFNTFTMSEYNGIMGPYTFPIGVGKGNMGLLLTNPKVNHHKFLKKPYALMYIQPPDLNFPHGHHCFLTFIHMICSKYKYPIFQIVIPEWICEIIQCYLETPQSGTCYRINKLLKEYTKEYPTVKLINTNKEEYFVKQGDPNDKTLILRGDILPKPRHDFISLIKYSVDDVLLTGDQSITDAFSCCTNKTIWYQIAPWKTKFALEMSKNIPDKYFKSFQTSCGTMKGIYYHPNYKKFLDSYDFRINGKPYFDSILLYTYFKDHPVLQTYMNIVESSRKLSTVKKKISKIYNE